ncbi:MAG: putative beta-lysine N-acetyltransferase [Bacillus sp. (in: firmicutes)]
MKQLPEVVYRTGDGYSCAYTIDRPNGRIRIDDYYGDMDAILEDVSAAAEQMDCEKMIIKARREQFQWLLERNFVLEASIDRYFYGSDLYFFSRFYLPTRRQSDSWTDEDLIVDQVQKLEQTGREATADRFELRVCTTEDAKELSDFYRNIFKVYPVPLEEPKYIIRCMETHSLFAGYFLNGKIVSAASADINGQYKNAEITDCGTLPEFRQFGLMQGLLGFLESQLKDKGIYCFYTLARAKSFGMNAAFFRLGYGYRGRLANNCYIGDGLEDMNVWVKKAGAGKRA